MIIFINMQKLIINSWKVMIKIKNDHKCWNVNNLYEWAIPQKLPSVGFKWFEKASQFNEDFIKSCNKDSDIGYFSFLPKRMITGKTEKHLANLYDKIEYVIHIRN